nr:PREDICTED: G-protein-signaling modulator 1 isoform X3 [Rhinolophus sinicus]
MPAVSMAQPRAGKTLALCIQRVHSAGPRGPAALGGQEGTRPRAGHCVSEGHFSLCLGQGRGGPGGAEAAVWGLGPAYEVGKLIGPLGCQGSRERGPGGRWSRVPAGCGARPKRPQRLSAEAWDLLRLPLERGQNGDSHHCGDRLPLPVRSRKYQEGLDAADRRPREGSHSPLDSADVRVQVPRVSIPRAPSSDEECFFDLLSKFQSSRMDDQRCPLEDGQPGAAEATAAPSLEERIAQPSLTASPQTEELFDLIASSQSRRLDDQRASVGSLPGLRITHNNLGHLRGDGDPQEPGDEFFNMLIKCQSCRLDDQRCPPPDGLPRGPTMPDEDFFSLIQRVQAKRMDEQRVDLAGSPEQEVGGPPEPRQQCQPGTS